jgi:hypothetical protein
MALVAAEIVHDDNVARLERRHEELLDIGLEAFAIDRSIKNARQNSGNVPRARPEDTGDLDGAQVFLGWRASDDNREKHCSYLDPGLVGRSSGCKPQG